MTVANVCLDSRASGGEAAAVIRVRAPSGRLRAFDAERVEIDNGLVTAVGQFRGDRQRQRRTWARERVLEILWREAVAA
jgi:hypothetical protein